MVVDSVAVLSFDLTGAGSAQVGAGTGQVSVFDMAQFEKAFQNQQTRVAPPAPASSERSGFEVALHALESLNHGVDGMGLDALRVAANSKELTPSEMINLTVQAHQFLFQSELTANVANRTSEGVQQLFRQQS